MDTSHARGEHERWGLVLRRPAASGIVSTERLHAKLERLSRQSWEHASARGRCALCYLPSSAGTTRPGRRTRTRSRCCADERTPMPRAVQAMSATLIEALCEQHRGHPSWLAQLLFDDLHARVDADPEFGLMRSYATLAG